MTTSETNAAELAKTLQADTSTVLLDAADLESLQEPLQAVSTTLRRMSSDLGIEGLSGDAAKESLSKVASAMLHKVDALVGIAGIAKEAATAIATAQSAYYELPRGYLTPTERQKLIDAGSSTGLPYIEAGLAAAREDAAKKAVTTAADALKELARQLPEAGTDHERSSDPGTKSPGGPGTRRPTPYVPSPGVQPPGGYVPGNPPGDGSGPPDTGVPTPTPTPNPTPYEPKPPVDWRPPGSDPSNPDPGGNPTVPGPDDPSWPGPGRGDDEDTHGDDRPGNGTVYGPGPVNGGVVGGGPGAGGPGAGGPGAGSPSLGTHPGLGSTTGPGGGGAGGAAGGALAGGVAVGGTALGAFGAARFGGGMGGLGGAPMGQLGGAVLGATPGGAAAAGGARSALSGGRGAPGGMMGGAMGGAAGSSKEKRRAGSLGYLAPELEEEETPAARATGLSRGSRADAPKVSVDSPEDDETW